MARAIGFDGNWTAPSTHGGLMRSWSANITMVETNVSGFGDDFEQWRGGMFGGTGSASGVPLTNVAASAPGYVNADRRTGVSLTLTQSTGCTITGTAIIPSIDSASEKAADATLVFSFRFTSTIVETWALS